MKRFLAFLLTIAMLCSLVMLLGCTEQTDDKRIDDDEDEKEEEQVEMVTVYLPATYTYSYELRRGDTYTTDMQFTYDDRGRCTRYVETSDITDGLQITGTEVSTYTFTYDAQGNLTSETKHYKATTLAGKVTEFTGAYTYTYTYNKNRQVTYVIIEHSNNGEIDYSEKYALEYDLRGNLIKAELQDGDPDYPLCWYFEYDKKNRMIQETQYRSYPYLAGPDEPAVPQYTYSQSQFTYDNRGNLTCITFGSARSYTFVEYEDVDQLDFNAQVLAEYCYNEKGQLTGSPEDPDEYQYDENGHLILEEQYETVKDRGQWVERLMARYTQDEHGNVTSFESYKSSATVTYVELELRKTAAAVAKRQFGGWFRQYQTLYSFGIDRNFYLTMHMNIYSPATIGYLIQNPPY